ncbi:MAG: sulfotransferase domain-containing protein [Cyclobacteriaceae bacterium]
MDNKIETNFTDIHGNHFLIELPKPSLIESFFVFSLVKAGSTLINNIVKEICDHNRISTISIYDQAFIQGIRTRNVPSAVKRIILDRGYGYLGFRHYFPFNDPPDLSRNKKILLVRDPRDILVSLYFSNYFSHVVPKEGEARQAFIRLRTESITSIDSFVLQKAESLLSEYKVYLQQIAQPLWKIYKYEDIIYQKRTWVEDLAQYLDLEMNDDLLRNILRNYDIFPAVEDQNSHIRQVHPGNFKKHLKHETISNLDYKFHDILKSFFT